MEDPGGRVVMRVLQLPFPLSLYHVLRNRNAESLGTRDSESEPKSMETPCPLRHSHSRFLATFRMRLIVSRPPPSCKVGRERSFLDFFYKGGSPHPVP